MRPEGREASLFFALRGARSPLSSGHRPLRASARAPARAMSRRKQLNVCSALDSSDAFDGVVELSDRFLTVVDVHLGWTGPCSVLEPIYRKVRGCWYAGAARLRCVCGSSAFAWACRLPHARVLHARVPRVQHPRLPHVRVHRARACGRRVGCMAARTPLLAPGGGCPSTCCSADAVRDETSLKSRRSSEVHAAHGTRRRRERH